MASFRILGNTPAIAFLACRLQEEGHSVEWWTSGYLSQLRPLRLRSESQSNLVELFRRNSVDTSFLTRSPSLDAWSTLRDGGSVVQTWPGMDEGFEDRWVEGSDLFRQLKALAIARGCAVTEVRGSLPDPLKTLGDSVALITDVCATELRLWPLPAREASATRIVERKSQSIVSLWLPRFGGEGDVALRGFLAASWKGVRMILEPHPKRGCVLTLSSSHAYAVEQTLKDVRNPKIAGLSGLRALFLLNGNSYSEERIRQNTGFAGDTFPMAIQLGKSIGNFCPMSNRQDDWSLRNAEQLVAHCERIKSFEAVALWHFAVTWNRTLKAAFRSEIRRQLIWEEWLFGNRWGRVLVRASRYLPKPLRNRLQAPI